MTPGLLALVLLAPAQPPAYPKGDERVYVGTVVENVDRPNIRYQRGHALEVRVLTLNATDAAVLTQLTRADDVVSGAVVIVSGRKPYQDPVASRLDLVRTRTTPAGRAVVLLSPTGSQLVLDRDTPMRALPEVPLDSFAPAEFGVFQPEPGKPDGEEVIAGERCLRLVAVKQSDDWAKPVGGQTAWQRSETVWVSGRDHTVRRVHRLLRQRDGLGPNLATVVETRYELKEQLPIAGRTFDRYFREIELATTTAAEVAPLLPDAVRLGPLPFQMRLRKIKDHLDENESGTPYRDGLLAVAGQLGAAQRGQIVAVPLTPLVGTARVDVGQAAPDFRAGSFRFADHRGRAAVLVFFKPGTETTDLALAIADALHRLYDGKVTVVPLVLFGDVADGVKDCDRLKLKVPVYDGAGAGAVYGADSFPRFVVIDAGGKVRWLFAGVGAETGYLVREEIDKLAPVGTASPTAPRTGDSPRRP